MNLLLTQQKFIIRLREELGIHVGPARVHSWIKDGMPVAPRGGKKPRFVWDLARNWLLRGVEPTPIRQDARDRLFLASLKRGA